MSFVGGDVDIASYNCDTWGSKHVCRWPRTNSLIRYSYTSIQLRFTTSRSKNDLAPKTFTRSPLQPHYTSAQPHDATIDPIPNKIPEDLPVTLYLNPRAAACAGKLKKKARSGATVRSEPRYGCVSDRRGGGNHHGMQTQGSWSCLSLFRQGKTSANVRSLNWWCDVYG